MGGMRKRLVGKPKPKDYKGKDNEESSNSSDQEEEIETDEFFNFVLFGGISARVPKWWNAKPLKKKKNVNMEQYDYYHQMSFKIICVLTFLTRAYKIDQPAWVCWDETHFGKFASHYINGTFFFDVHPPLGKMLLGLAGYMTDYNGAFAFEKPGDMYGEHHYVGMRLFCAALGGLCVPLAYLTVWELTHCLAACVLSATFILFDNGCTTISRYILLDPLLMFFVMTSIYFSVKFHSWREHPFRPEWWGWMICTGFSLACAFSVKWVGLFVILFVGVTTVQDIWDQIGDLSLTMVDLVKQFMARVLGLIVVPAIAYLCFFSLHFKYLPRTGTGDGFFSSAFQSTLIGNELNNAKIPGDLAYGARITLKNYQSSGVLLHSHSSLYPKEHPPEQQQITGYNHKDPNSEWKVHKAFTMPTEDDPLELVRDGDIVRLMHAPTERNLHSHNEKAPISTSMMQVTGYGVKGDGDTNDNWRVQIVDNPGKDGVVNTVRTRFRLIHNNSGCALADTGNILPKWGFEQREIACNMMSDSAGTIWNVENNKHKQVVDVSMGLMAPSFFESVYESHILMAKTNNGFKPKEGEFNSQPWHWPINYKGQVFSGLDYRIYLLGNPIIWWLILATYLLYVGYFLFFEIRNKRGCETDIAMREKSQVVVGTCTWLLVGWSLHYFPFYLMGRVLYFHHYFPSYLISAMMAGILLEHIIKVLSLLVPDKILQKKIYLGSIGFLLFLSIASFYAFRGLTYGMSGPNSKEANSTQAAYRWLDAWDI